MPLATTAQGHPLELVFVALVAVGLVSWVFGFAPGLSFATVLVVGFIAAVAILVGAYSITLGRYLQGVLIMAVGFGLIAALGAGWVRF